MYRVAQEQLFHPRYTTLRGVLYSYAAEGGLTGKQLLAVTEVRRADWVEEGVTLVRVQECHKDRSGCALLSIFVTVLLQTLVQCRKSHPAWLLPGPCCSSCRCC